MKKDIHATIDKLNREIESVKSIKDEEINKLKKLLKEAEDKKQKAAQNYFNVLWDEFCNLVSKHDVQSRAYYTYLDSSDDEGKEMLYKLTDEVTRLDLNYDWDMIIDECLKNAEERADAMKGYVEALKEFKEYLKELYKEQK